MLRFGSSATFKLSAMRHWAPEETLINSAFPAGQEAHHFRRLQSVESGGIRKSHFRMPRWFRPEWSV